jgi:mannose-6-phosphate isomerase-like protein (cupin superfamily)
MKSALLAVVVVSAVGGLGLLAQAPRGGQPAGGDSKTPIFWSAQRMKEIDTGLSTRVSPQTNMAGERLLASANVIYRAGNSGSEIHEKLADFIFVREGEGSIVIGGKLIGGQPSAPDEIRGDSIEGGTRYPVAAGDTLYIPANVPHQFFVEKGKHWVITIVKITPKP